VKKFRNSLAVKTVMCCSIAAHFPSYSDDAGNNYRLEEIVVTAQRREQGLQDVPIAVNVLTSSTLEAMAVTNTQALMSVVPGLEFTSTGPSGIPYLRGVGSNAGNPNDEPSVATYVDGVYIASPQANIMNLQNIDRVEVLKGPQGTLFGRNATGGVIQVITRNPEIDPTIEVQAGYAKYDTVSGMVYLAGGLSDTISANLAVQGEQQGKGWGTNILTNQDVYYNDTYSARAKLLFAPNDSTQMLLTIDVAESEGSVADYKLAEGVLSAGGELNPPGNFDTIGIIKYNDIRDPVVDNKQQGISLRLEHDFSFARGVSISAYRELDGKYFLDPDVSSLAIVDAVLRQDQSNYSQELQLLSRDDSALEWVLGTYIYRNDAGYVDSVLAGIGIGGTEDSAVVLNGNQVTESYSVYAQATGEIARNTELTLGVRYTDEEQEFSSSAGAFVAPDQERGFEEVTWRLALNYRFTDNVSTYASYNRGVKGGGFDLLSTGSFGYDPEILDAYEIGVKSELLDNRLRLNGSAFFYDYQDIQVQAIPNATVQTTNAGKAEIMGLDVDISFALTEELMVFGGFAVLDGEYKEFPGAISYPESPLDPAGQIVFDASGANTIRTPDLSGSISAQYQLFSAAGEFPITVTYIFNDGYFYAADNKIKSNPHKQDAFGLLNVSAGWRSPDGKYSVTAWGRNLTDEYYYVQGVPSGYGDIYTPAAPRMFGVDLRVVVF
jgi:iron complex outermembrane recepter protein